MIKVEDGYLYYREKDNIAYRYPISDLIEGAGLVEFKLNKSVEIPMVLNEAGFFWAIKRDEDGNNLYVYEKFPYKIEKLEWKVEYVNED